MTSLDMVTHHDKNGDGNGKLSLLSPYLSDPMIMITVKVVINLRLPTVNLHGYKHEMAFKQISYK